MSEVLKEKSTKEDVIIFTHTNLSSKTVKKNKLKKNKCNDLLINTYFITNITQKAFPGSPIGLILL